MTREVDVIFILEWSPQPILYEVCRNNGRKYMSSFLASIRRVKNFFWILFDAHPTSRELTVLSINDEPHGSDESSQEVYVDS